MKRMTLILFALIAFAAVPAHAQRLDAKNIVDVSKGMIPATRANTAVSGPWIDLQNYSGAAMLVTSGLMDAAAQYIVLEDSVVGSAVAVKDSTNVGVDSTTSTMAYRGAGRYIRVTLRASGNAADTSWVGAVALLVGKRGR